MPNGRRHRGSCNRVAEGNHSDQFPVPLMHGGGGTSANMNINEVLATRATQLLAAAHSDLTVHPNDHVNASQSTNDTYPTAMAITLLDRADHQPRRPHRCRTYFADKCITGLVWNSQALQRNLAGFRHDYVEIAARAGYDVAAASAQIR